MLDTSILIYLIRNKPPSVAARINGLEADTEVCMSSITFAELLKGAERSRQPDSLRTLRNAVHPAACNGHTHRCQ